MMPDRAGQRLDNYQLIRMIGSGTFGEVYLAEHMYRKGLVALKVLPQMAANELPGFFNEARSIRLKHPHIVQILDFGIDNRVPFIVMDYAPHGTLRELYPRGRRIPMEVIVSYVKQIASALDYAHSERIIHRDIKPENLLLGSKNEVLVSDFGIATIAHSSRSQSTQEMAGTVTYMAPEQLQGKPRFASDQYALGVIVYEWLCGERPFNGSVMEIATQHMLTAPPPLHEKLPGIPLKIEQVVMSALAKEPKDRFASMQEFATALEEAYKEQLSPPTTPVQIVAKEPLSMSRVQQDQVIQPPVSSMNVKPRAVNHLVQMQKEQQRYQRRSRLFYPVLAFFILLVVSLVSGSLYYLLVHNAITVNVDTSLRDARNFITIANAEITANPTDAFQKLANAHTTLLKVQAASRTVAQDTTFKDVQTEYLTAFKDAITTYNTHSLITQLPCTDTTSNKVNTDTTNTQAVSIAAIQDTKGIQFYALGGNNTLYQVSTPSNNQRSLINPFKLDSPLLKITSDGSRLLALTSNSATNPTNYGLHLLLPDPSGSGALQDSNISTIDSTLTKDSNTPPLITAWGPDVFVVITSTSTPNVAVILDYPVERNALNKPSETKISFSIGIASVAAFPNKQLLLLDESGAIFSLNLVNGNPTTSATTAVVTKSIAPPLPVSVNEVNFNTPVPQVTTSLAFPRTSLLVAGEGLDSSIPARLYVVDDVHHRILVLRQNNAVSSTTATPANPTMELLQQYTSTQVLFSVKSIAIDPKIAQIDLLAQDNQNTLNFVSVNVAQGATCTPAS